jgi:hypothetical protein
MPPDLRAVLGRLNLTLLGITILVATFWFTDHITNRQPAAPHIDPAEVLAKRKAQPSSERVFVYIIDSLRYETATDPAIMPNLYALRAEGAYARTMPGFNSGSAASLRDAFTGRENAAVLAAVATFIHSDAGVESLFHQMALQGLTTAAYSAGFFHQFGAGITKEVEVGFKSSRKEQEAHVLSAVATFRGGEFNCVFGHLLYTDAVAHEEDGVGTPRYREAFRQADALIPVIRAQLPAGSTFVVMGDHGHDLKGRHGIGLNVPTLAVYVGPRFRRGADLGSTSIMSHRYLLSQALGLPMTTEAYAGDLLPAALDLQRTTVRALISGVRASPAGGGSWLIWIYLSLFATVWFNLVCIGSSPLNFSGWRALAPWAGVAPFFLHGNVQLTSAIFAAAGMLVILAWRVPRTALVRWLGLPVVAGLMFQGWGHALNAARPWLEQLPLSALVVYWLSVATVGACFANRQRRPWIMAGVFAVPAFLFHPVYHIYGFPGTLAPLIACWFIFYVVSSARAGDLKETGSRAKLGWIAAGLFLTLQPFAASVTSSGIFDHWQALVPTWSASNWSYMLIPAVLAKVLLFFPRRPTWITLTLGITLIVLLQLIESRFWGPDYFVRRRFALVMLAGWTLGTWQKRPEARLCGLTLLFILYYSFVALTPRNFTDIAAMTGALGLCAQLVVWFPQRENIRSDYLILALLGLMITGWAGMQWSGTHLEWHAIYEFASAPTVERYVGWFIPWIALKGLLPWIIILWLLRDRLGAFCPLPARSIMIFFCAKMLALLMLAIGLGGIDTYNRSYLETASVVGAMTMLYLGIVLLPRAWSSSTNVTN